MKREPIRPIHEGANTKGDRPNNNPEDSRDIGPAFLSLVLMPNSDYPFRGTPVDYADYYNGPRSKYQDCTPVLFSVHDTPENRQLIDDIGELITHAVANHGMNVLANRQRVYGGEFRLDDGQAYTDGGSLQVYEDTPYIAPDGYVKYMRRSCYWVDWYPNDGVNAHHITNATTTNAPR